MASPARFRMDTESYRDGAARAARLIVNADDFGYFDGVSRGILECLQQGVVTATGVMANGPALGRWAEPLRALSGISVGVHLNASLGEPLTAAMQRALGGRFPSKGAMGLALLRGKIPRALLLAEWRAQIEHCRSLGLQLAFLNSHEHLHVMPGLYPAVRALAAEFGIRHVRGPSPEWGRNGSAGALARNLVFVAARGWAGRAPAGEPTLLGVAPSGRLDLGYCRWRFSRLAPGRSFELMCHPGHADPAARGIPALTEYHDWEAELRTLMSADFRQLLQQHGIVLTTYSGLQ